MSRNIQDVLNFIRENQRQSTFRPTIPGEDGPTGDTTGMWGSGPIRPTISPDAGVPTLEEQDRRRIPPRMPAAPDSRMDVWRNLLTDFVWSLGEGMKARPKGKGAGIGEALIGPWTLEELKLKQKLEQQRTELMQAQEDRTKTAQQEAMAKIAQYQTELPAKLQEIIARTGLSNSQTQVNQARIPQIQAQTAETLSDMAQKTMLKVGNSVFRLSDLMAPDASNVKPINAANPDEGINIVITPDMARQIGQPQLSGQTVSAKVGSQITSMISSGTKTTPTAAGVLRTNLLTGEETNLGAPAGVAVAQARPVDVIGPSGLPVVTSAGTAIQTGAVPGRLSDVNRLTGQAAAFSNFHSNANAVRSLLPAIDHPGATTRIAAAMAHPEGTIRQWIQGQLATGNLTNDEYDLINALATFREDIFNMRQFFGNAPIRSDAQVSLMLAQIPSVADLSTGSAEQVGRKIDNFERSIMAVESKFGPLMSLVNNPQFKATIPGTTAPTSTTTTTPTANVPDFIIQNGKLVRNPAKK